MGTIPPPLAVIVLRYPPYLKLSGSVDGRGKAGAQNESMGLEKLCSLQHGGKVGGLGRRGPGMPQNLGAATRSAFILPPSKVTGCRQRLGVH